MTENPPPAPAVHPPPEENSAPRWTFFLLLGGLLLLTLIPYAQAGFFCDDAINSTFPGTMRLTGKGLWEHILINNRVWMDAGRFYPLAQAGTFLNWAYLHDLPYERAGQIALILLNIVVFARFLTRVTGSRAAALIFVAALPAFFQARTWADPMLDFSPLLQQEMLFLVLSLDSFWAAMDGGHPRWRLALAWVWFTLAMLTYEVGLTTAAIAAVLAVFGWRKARRIALWGFGGYAVLAVAYVAINLYLKAQAAKALYQGVALSVNALALHAYGLQLGAVVPLTYYFADPHGFLRHAPWPSLDKLAVAAAIVVLTMLVVLEACKHLRPLRYHGALAAGACAVLACVPAGFVAISSMYQTLIVWGLAYLPVYLEFFGFAAVVIVLLCQLLTRLRGRPAAAAALAFGLLAGAGNAAAFLVNNLMVEHENTFWLYPRIVDEQAAHEGLFDQVPDGSILVRDGWRAWDIPAFYAQHAHHRFDVVRLDKLLAAAPDTEFGRIDLSTRSCYEVRSDAVLWPHGGGWAMVARLQSVDYRKAGAVINVLGRRLQDPLIFKLASGIPSTQQVNFAETGLVTLRGLAGVPWRVDRLAVPVRTAQKWGLYQLPAGIYHAGSPRPEDDNLYPGSVRRPFLVEPAMPDPAAPAGRLELSALDSPSLPAAPAGVGFGCELTDGGVALGTEPFSRLELKCPGQANGLGLAFRVWPNETQGPNATIVCNHLPETRGFTLERLPGGGPGTYFLAVGDGKQWQTAGTVQLALGQWNTVVLSFSPQSSEIHVGGSGSPQQGSIACAPAPVADDIVRFGNWVQYSRPFQGTIKDFVRLPRPFTPAEISALLQTGPAVPSQEAAAAAP